MMIVFLLGLSIMLNIVLGFVIFFIYRYSLKGVKNKIESEFLKSYEKDLYSIEDVFSDKEVKNYDHKSENSRQSAHYHQLLCYLYK